MMLDTLSVTEQGSDMIITTRRRQWFLSRWLGRAPITERWRGSCTVWRSYPDGQRAKVWMETYLAGEWTRRKWSRGVISSGSS
jgi:hypothetical protein